MNPTRFPYSSPYWPVVSHPRLRRVLPGLAASALGDGMSVVAISWLALELAPDGQRATWLAVAVAAYTLPSALGGFLLGRFLDGRGGARLTEWNALLRGGALAAIVAVHLAGALSIGLYVTLLAVSALLAAWGSAGRFTLIAELLPARDHLAGNAVITTMVELSTVVGPPLAGLLIAWTGPSVVLALDAATFAVLAVTCRLALPGGGPRTADGAQKARGAGFATIRRDRTLLALLGLTFGLFFLFGPFYAAMPIHVADDLRGSATLLGGYYTAFGIGAVAGGLASAYLRRWSLWPTTTGIVLGFGTAMLPLGLGAPVAVSMACFAFTGMFWGPFVSTTIALFQRTTPAVRLPQVLAANSSVLVVAVPLGTMLGGPLTTVLGARQTLLLSALAIVGLGLATAAALALRRSRRAARSTVYPAPVDHEVVAPERDVSPRQSHDQRQTA